MNIAKGFLPSSLTVPAYILILFGYVYAGLMKFADVEVIPGGLGISWTACVVGLFILGQTREKIEDERVAQFRSYSYMYLSGLLIGILYFHSVFLLYSTEHVNPQTIPPVFLFALLLHVCYQKFIIHFDALNPITGNSKYTSFSRVSSLLY